LLEDFFLTATVDTRRVVELVRVAQSARVGSLKLAAGLPLAIPPSLELPGVSGVGAIPKGDEYRVTLQAAVWRIQTLRRLLAPGLSAWDFEVLGTQMAEGLDDVFWAVLEPAIAYDHAIEKGKWKPVGLAILKDAGVAKGESDRGVFSPGEFAAYVDRLQAESSRGLDRNLALRHFLNGRKLAGLRCVWRRIRSGNATAAELLLAAAGSMGAAVTRKALSFHVSRQLRSRARQESVAASLRSSYPDSRRHA
jgi:hypothetical protein